MYIKCPLWRNVSPIYVICIEKRFNSLRDQRMEKTHDFTCRRDEANKTSCTVRTLSTHFPGQKPDLLCAESTKRHKAPCWFQLPAGVADWRWSFTVQSTSKIQASLKTHEQFAEHKKCQLRQWFGKDVGQIMFALDALQADNLVPFCSMYEDSCAWPNYSLWLSPRSKRRTCDDLLQLQQPGVSETNMGFEPSPVCSSPPH